MQNFESFVIEKLKSIIFLLEPRFEYPNLHLLVSLMIVKVSDLRGLKTITKYRKNA